MMNTFLLIAGILMLILTHAITYQLGAIGALDKLDKELNRIFKG